MIFAVDFDGTCVTPNFPKLGVNIGAAPVLKALQTKGHKVFLWSLRGNKSETFDGKNLNRILLTDVYLWEKNNDFKFNGYNEVPGGQEWTDSPKQYASVYIDDMAIGCPLRQFNRKVAVDWIDIARKLTYIYKIFTVEELYELVGQIREEISINKENYEKMCIQVGLTDS